MIRSSLDVLRSVHPPQQLSVKFGSAHHIRLIMLYKSSYTFLRLPIISGSTNTICSYVRLQSISTQPLAGLLATATLINPWISKGLLLQLMIRRWHSIMPIYIGFTGLKLKMVRMRPTFLTITSHELANVCAITFTHAPEYIFIKLWP